MKEEGKDPKQAWQLLTQWKSRNYVLQSKQNAGKNVGQI